MGKIVIHIVNAPEGANWKSRVLGLDAAAQPVVNGVAEFTGVPVGVYTVSTSGDGAGDNAGVSFSNSQPGITIDAADPDATVDVLVDFSTVAPPADGEFRA